MSEVKNSSTLTQEQYYYLSALAYVDLNIIEDEKKIYH